MIGAKVSGLPDLREALAGIVPKLRFRALRLALAAGARLVQKTARSRTPVLKLSTHAGRYAYRKGIRKPGTVAKAISVRTSKASRRAGNVGVFVNVKPAKGMARGAKSFRDPFYWRWLNFGWSPAGRQRAVNGIRRRQRMHASGVRGLKPGAHFLEEGAKRLGAALDEFKRRIIPAIAKLNRPKAPAP